MRNQSNQPDFEITEEHFDYVAQLGYFYQVVPLKEGKMLNYNVGQIATVAGFQYKLPDDMSIDSVEIEVTRVQPFQLKSFTVCDLETVNLATWAKCIGPNNCKAFVGKYKKSNPEVLAKMSLVVVYKFEAPNYSLKELDRRYKQRFEQEK